MKVYITEKGPIVSISSSEFKRVGSDMIIIPIWGPERFKVCYSIKV